MRLGEILASLFEGLPLFRLLAVLWEMIFAMKVIVEILIVSKIPNLLMEQNPEMTDLLALEAGKNVAERFVIAKVVKNGREIDRVVNYDSRQRKGELHRRV